MLESQGWFGNLIYSLILLIISPFIWFFGVFNILGGNWYWAQDALLESDFLSPLAYGAAKVTFN